MPLVQLVANSSFVMRRSKLRLKIRVTFGKAVIATEESGLKLSEYSDVLFLERATTLGIFFISKKFRHEFNIPFVMESVKQKYAVFHYMLFLSKGN